MFLSMYKGITEYRIHLPCLYRYTKITNTFSVRPVSPNSKTELLPLKMLDLNLSNYIIRVFDLREFVATGDE